MHQPHKVVFTSYNFSSQHDPPHRVVPVFRHDKIHHRRDDRSDRNGDSKRDSDVVKNLNTGGHIQDQDQNQQQEQLHHHHHHHNGGQRGYMYTTNLVDAGLCGEMLFLDVPNHGYYIKTCLRTFVELYASHICVNRHPPTTSSSSSSRRTTSNNDDDDDDDDAKKQRPSSCGFAPFVGHGVHRVVRKATKTKTSTDGTETQEETRIEEEKKKVPVPFLFIVRRIEKSRKKKKTVSATIIGLTNIGDLTREELDVFQSTYREALEEGLSRQTAEDRARQDVELSRSTNINMNGGIDAETENEEDDGIPQFQKILHSELNKLYFDGRVADTQPIFVVVPYHQGQDIVGGGGGGTGGQKEHEVDPDDDVSAYKMWSSIGQPMWLQPSSSETMDSTEDTTTDGSMASSSSSSPSSPSLSSQQRSRQKSNSNSNSPAVSSESDRYRQSSGSDSSPSSSNRSDPGSQPGSGSRSGGGAEGSSSSSSSSSSSPSSPPPPLKYADVDDWIKRVIQRDKSITKMNQKKEDSSTRKRKNETNGENVTADTGFSHSTNTTKLKTKQKQDNKKRRRLSKSGGGSSGTTGGGNRGNVGRVHGRDLQQIVDGTEELVNHDTKIELVMGQTGCSRESAIYALRENDNCVVEACLSLTTSPF